MQASRTVQVNIGDKLYAITSDDDYLFHIQGGFEPQMVTLFSSLIGREDTVLDVGANIGCTALLFGDLAKKVLAFEPSPSTFKFLQRNIENSRKDNIQIRNVGLGESEGSFELTFSPSNRSGGFVSDRLQAGDGHTTETIKISRLDDLKDFDSVQFIKLDVEGFEGHVIKGGMRTILANKPVVVLEVNHWCLNAFQRTSLPDFCDFLKSVFPLLYAVDGDRYLDLSETSDLYVFLYNVESRSGAVADAPFPLPAHRTVRADFPHTALGQELTPSPTERFEDGRTGG